MNLKTIKSKIECGKILTEKGVIDILSEIGANNIKFIITHDKIHLFRSDMGSNSCVSYRSSDLGYYGRTRVVENHDITTIICSKCGNNPILDCDYDSTPGFRDTYYTLKCNHCDNVSYGSACITSTITQWSVGQSDDNCIIHEYMCDDYRKSPEYIQQQIEMKKRRLIIEQREKDFRENSPDNLLRYELGNHSTIFQSIECNCMRDWNIVKSTNYKSYKECSKCFARKIINTAKKRENPSKNDILWLTGEKSINRKNEPREILKQKKVADTISASIRNLMHENRLAGALAKHNICDFDCVKKHLEDNFQVGMKWDNYGKNGWHVSYVKPLTSFDLTVPNQFTKACNYKNLKPIWSNRGTNFELFIRIMWSYYESGNRYSKVCNGREGTVNLLKRILAELKNHQEDFDDVLKKYNITPTGMSVEDIDQQIYNMTLEMDENNSFNEMLIERLEKRDASSYALLASSIYFEIFRYRK